MTPEEKLASLGIALPEPPAPLGSYIPVLRSGNLLFLSGLLPVKEGWLVKAGKLGADMDEKEGAGLARIAAVNALAVVKGYLGELDKVKRCVKITGYVAGIPGFTGQAAVLNGASDFLVQIFGEPGRHVRAAVGVTALPMDSPLEIEFIFEVF